MRVNNKDRAMNRIDASFKPNEIDAKNGGEALVYGWNGYSGAKGNVSAAWNVLHGRSASAETRQKAQHMKKP